MIRMLKRLSAVSALALAVFAWGCENVGEVTQPSPRPGGQVYSTADGSRYMVAKERDPNVGAVTAIIGEAGGKLILDRHELWVPQGAVSGLTTFTLSKSDSDNLRVRLRKL